jgi:thioredoxin 2
MIRVCASCSAENRVALDKLDKVAKCGRCKAQLPPPREPVAVESEADFEALMLHSPFPVVVDFWAAWCGPCRAVAPELERLAESKSGKVLIAKVDTERLPQLAQKFGIRSIPTLVRFDRARETQRVSGAMRAEQLAQELAL